MRFAKLFSSTVAILALATPALGHAANKRPHHLATHKAPHHHRLAPHKATPSLHTILLELKDVVTSGCTVDCVEFVVDAGVCVAEIIVGMSKSCECSKPMTTKLEQCGDCIITAAKGTSHAETIYNNVITGYQDLCAVVLNFVPLA